ncbi:hypothetical protein L596_026222 [Steinernema carpocapsae]|uniref:Uncharacterized protein n=1 Tax=Steinernema carpocapsae TaxID=34508 RepID=A0A4U5M0Q5_STECR|nr:hypothetical protein L596_026222 [Steinernema carpocapsae]
MFIQGVYCILNLRMSTGNPITEKLRICAREIYVGRKQSKSQEKSKSTPQFLQRFRKARPVQSYKGRNSAAQICRRCGAGNPYYVA